MLREIEMHLPQGPHQPVPPAVLSISACQDNQVTLDGTINSMFTGTLLNVWATGAFQDYPTFRDRIAAGMPPYSTPVLSGAGSPNPAFLHQLPLTI
jgi:hypothetical protein